MENNENKDKKFSYTNENGRRVRVMNEPSTEVLAEIILRLMKKLQDLETKENIIKSDDNS